MEQVNKKFLSGQPIIAQLICLIFNEVFDQAVVQTNADWYYKQMKAKDHFICLFYAVLTRNSSLREVCKNITLIARKLLYVGLKQLPCKSTLSDASRKRDSGFFAASTNENSFLKVLRLPEGGIAVFDKGFNKYRCFDVWTQRSRFFVTRLKDNAQLSGRRGKQYRAIP